jgi:hypothetical protein
LECDAAIDAYEQSPRSKLLGEIRLVSGRLSLFDSAIPGADALNDTSEVVLGTVRKGRNRYGLSTYRVSRYVHFLVVELTWIGG